MFIVLVDFGLMLKCFGPVRSGENIIGSVQGRGHQIYQVGEKDKGAFQGQGVKNLALQDSTKGVTLVYL